MNKNTKARKATIREKTKKMGGNFLHSQASVIEAGSERRPVTMAFTSKWESNSAHRCYGL